MPTIPMRSRASADTAARTQILVVEDERIVALHLRQKLIKLGYQISATASSGDQALREIQKKAPDLILMDIQIEGKMDGIETARAISPGLQIPVIYLTANSGNATLERARDTHPYGYLLKPFSDRELHATIQMALARHTIDEALRKSEERLSLAFESAGMGPWELDLSTRQIVHLDRHMDGADGMSGAGESAADAWNALLDGMHKEDRPQLEAMIEHLSSGDIAGEAEFRTPVGDSTRWVKMLCKRFVDNPQRIVGVMQDVTKIHEREDRLRKSAAELAARAECLSEAADSAAAANHTKSHFLAVMSHELRTPLNAILGFGQLLQCKKFGELTALQWEYVDHIMEAGGHLLKLINDLLDLSKIDVQKLEVTIEKVEVAPLVRRIVASFSLFAAESDIELVAEMQGELAVAADETRLNQVLRNLVSNAIKYSRPGGMVRVTQQSAGDCVRIIVADNGIGIPEERQKEVFEPFNRLGAEHGTVEGTGIGLLLTKRLVELMGGEIGFESVQDVGSKFWVELPAHWSTMTNASHDPATGLPNREILYDRIGQAIALAPRHKRKVAILSLHLHGLEDINESLGHPMGAKVVKSVAKRLVDCVRRSDTVSRHGNEDFIVLSEVKKASDVAILAKRMLQAVTQPHVIGRQDLLVDASIGISIYPEDGRDADSLVENAQAQRDSEMQSARPRAEPVVLSDAVEHMELG